ncbi:MAG: beta strand repeat-containing protein, partial [Pirellulales bacterium]
SQVGSAFSTPTVGASYSLNTAFVSNTAPYNVPAGTTVTFKIVPLGSTGGASSPKFKWISTATSAADLSLVGTTGGGAWEMFWSGGASGTWNYVDASWLKDNTGSSQAFVAGDNATVATAAALTLDPAGISAGVVTASATSGTTTFGGGSLAAGSLIKSGAGTLVLSSSNSFASGGTLAGGSVQVDNATGLGTVAMTFDGSTLVNGGGVSAVATPFTVGAGGMTVANASDLTLSGLIIGGSSGRFTKTDAGNLTLSGVFGTQNTAPLEMDLSSGTTTLSSGQKNVGGPAVTNDWNGSVVLNGATVMIHGGVVSGSGIITNESSASVIASRLNIGVVTVANNIVLNQSLTGSSPNGNNRLTFTGNISGAGGLALVGNGTKQFDGINTYQGPTTITAGVARINGSLTNASTVTVTGPATLSGSGSINSTTTVQNLGVLSPNVPEGAARLTFGNGLTLDAGASTTWNLYANTDATGDAGALLGYSQVAVTGGNLTVTSGATLNLVFSGSGSTVLWSDPFWNTSRSWTIVDYSGSGSESLANYTISNVSFVDSGTQALDTVTRGSFSVSNNGQDMFLNFNAVPEPASAVLAGFGILAAAAAVRRLRMKQRLPDAPPHERRSA